MKQSNNKKSRDVTAFLYERLSRDDNMDGESYSIRKKATRTWFIFLMTASPALRWIVPALPI